MCVCGMNRALAIFVGQDHTIPLLINHHYPLYETGKTGGCLTESLGAFLHLSPHCSQENSSSPQRQTDIAATGKCGVQTMRHEFTDAAGTTKNTQAIY